MLYSPRWLSLYPGTVLFTLAMLASIWLLWGPRTVGRITFDAGTLLFSRVTIRIGLGCLNFAAFTEVFAVPRGFLAGGSTPEPTAPPYAARNRSSAWCVTAFSWS